MTLGKFTGRNLKTMRAKYDAALHQMENGVDPTAQKRRQVGTSFGHVAERYIVEELLAKDKNGKPVLRQGHQAEGYLRRLWLGEVLHQKKISTFNSSSWQNTWEPGSKPYFKNTPAARIEREHIIERLDEIAAEHGKFAARHALDAIRRCLNWAAKKPAFGLKFSAATGLVDADIGLKGKALQRTRVLTDDELRAIWNACEDDAFGKLVKLLLLTGQRRNDIAHMVWPELSDTPEGKLLTIPPARFKSAAAQEVPLSAMAAEIIDGLPRIKGSPYVLTSAGKRFSGFSKPKRRLDMASGAKGWKLHDLRRTVRTRLGQLRIEPLIAELVIGHSAPSLHQIYDQSTHREEKREALEKWAAKLATILSPPPAKKGKASLRLVAA